MLKMQQNKLINRVDFFYNVLKSKLISLSIIPLAFCFLLLPANPAWADNTSITTENTYDVSQSSPLQFHFNTALLLFNEGKYEEAIHNIRLYIFSNPINPEAYRLKSKIVQKLREKNLDTPFQIERAQFMLNNLSKPFFIFLFLCSLLFLLKNLQSDDNETPALEWSLMLISSIALVISFTWPKAHWKTVKSLDTIVYSNLSNNPERLIAQQPLLPGDAVKVIPTLLNDKNWVFVKSRRLSKGWIKKENLF